MGELRTLTLMATAVFGTPQYVDHLFEKKTTIVAVHGLLNADGDVAGSASAWLNKTNKAPAHETPGQILDLQVVLNKQTSGMANGVVSEFIRFHPDFIEVEEDDYLYLRVQTTVANLTAMAIFTIYYRD